MLRFKPCPSLVSASWLPTNVPSLSAPLAEIRELSHLGRLSSFSFALQQTPCTAFGLNSLSVAEENPAAAPSFSRASTLCWTSPKRNLSRPLGIVLLLLGCIPLVDHRSLVGWVTTVPLVDHRPPIQPQARECLSHCVRCSGSLCV